MSLRRWLITALCLAVLPTLAGCPKSEPVTDQQVVRYIQAYKALKKAGPKAAAMVGKQGQKLPDAGQAGYQEIEKAIKSAGFKDYPEFVRVNAAVAWAFSQGQGDAFLKDMDGQQKAAIAQIDAQLKNPNVPPPVKAQLQASRKQIIDEFKKNKGWADVSMNVTSKLTDKASVAVVMKHRKELEAAFTGR